MATQEKIRVNLDEPRYDQTNFLGRFRHFVNVTDVRNTLNTQQDLDAALKILNDYDAAKRPPVSLEEAEKIWAAKKVKDSMVHPDTGEKIFLPFRLSAFMPVNVLICAGLLIPNPSIPSMMFWQWMNQSYNLAMNHANRNASNQLSNSVILQTYVGAVGVSCGLAVGLDLAVKKAAFLSHATRATLGKFVPFVAASGAGVANVFLMRGNEMKSGIMVRDSPKGEELGKSPMAGLYALSQVSVSRVLTTFACLSVPPIVMSVITKPKVIQSRPALHFPLNLAVIGASMLSFLPAAIAVFPQNVAVPVKKLEPEFHNLRDAKGNKIETVYYNKGL